MIIADFSVVTKSNIVAPLRLTKSGWRFFADSSAVGKNNIVAPLRSA